METTDQDIPGPPRRRLLFAFGGLALLTGAGALSGCDARNLAGPAGSAGSPSPRHSGTGSPSARASGSPSLPDRPAPPVSPSPLGPGSPSTVALTRPQRTVSDGPKGICLTLDDGPSPIYTPQVLALLQHYGISAAFSMIGVSVAAYPSIATDVAAAGHTIVNHTWRHPDLAYLRPTAIADQMARTSDLLHETTGTAPSLFRAPYGAWSPAVFELCARAGMTPLGWSVDPRDWSRPGSASIIGNILRNTTTGSIILEHDGGGDRSQTVAALRVVLPRLLDAGYHFFAP